MERSSINEVAITSEELRAVRQRRRSKCCSSCNSQIFCSYVLALVSTGLVVGGVYLSICNWDRVWLIFSALGLILVFIGSCMHYCGTQALRKYDDNEQYSRRRRQKQRRGRFRDRGFSGDELVPSAPQGADSRSLSQLSLNMIPQYFSRAEGSAISTTAASPSMAYSQIFNVNGQSFLILPLSNETVNNSLTNQEANIPLNGLVVKIPVDQEAETRKALFAEFLNRAEPKATCQTSKGEQAIQTECGSFNFGEQGSSKQRNIHNPVIENVDLVNLSPAVATSSSDQPRLSDERSPNNEQVVCSSVNATSYFVSFPSNAGPNTCSTNSNEHDLTDNSSVRSSVRRQGTFRQNRPTVITVTSSSTNDQSYDTAGNRISTDFLIDLDHSQNAPSVLNTTADTINTENSGSDFTQNLYPDDAEVEITEEHTPPPSYAEVLEDTTHFSHLNSTTANHGTL